MLRKGVYPYEYLYNQKNFTETLLPDNEDFSTNLNMEGNTNTDYRHAEKSMEKLLNEKPSEIMICMFKATYYYLQMYLKFPQ